MCIAFNRYPIRIESNPWIGTILRKAIAHPIKIAIHYNNHVYMAKRIMANPKASKNGVSTQFKQKHSVALAEKPIPVRLPVDIDAAVRKLSNRSEWLRQVITEAAQRELMTSTQATPGRKEKPKPFKTFRGLNLRARQRLTINGHPCTMKGWIGDTGDEIEVRFDEMVAIGGKRPVFNAHIKAADVESLTII
jgi:hypothetical protein